MLILISQLKCSSRCAR